MQNGVRGQYSFKSGHFEISGGVVAELASSKVMSEFKVSKIIFDWPPHAARPGLLVS